MNCQDYLSAHRSSYNLNRFQIFFPELIMVSLITDARLQLDILNVDKGEIKTLFLHVKPF